MGIEAPTVPDFKTCCILGDADGDFGWNLH